MVQTKTTQNGKSQRLQEPMVTQGFQDSQMLGTAGSRVGQEAIGIQKVKCVRPGRTPLPVFSGNGLDTVVTGYKTHWRPWGLAKTTTVAPPLEDSDSCPSEKPAAPQFPNRTPPMWDTKTLFRYCSSATRGWVSQRAGPAEGLMPLMLVFLIPHPLVSGYFLLWL